jgi:hypothetical protein
MKLNIFLKYLSTRYEVLTCNLVMSNSSSPLYHPNSLSCIDKFSTSYYCTHTYHSYTIHQLISYNHIIPKLSQFYPFRSAIQSLNTYCIINSTHLKFYCPPMVSPLGPPLSINFLYYSIMVSLPQQPLRVLRTQFLRNSFSSNFLL